MENIEKSSKFASGLTGRWNMTVALAPEIKIEPEPTVSDLKALLRYRSQLVFKRWITCQLTDTLFSALYIYTWLQRREFSLTKASFIGILRMEIEDRLNY